MTVAGEMIGFAKMEAKLEIRRFLYDVEGYTNENAYRSDERLGQQSLEAIADQASEGALLLVPMGWAC